jgi:hypothetical protein
MLPDKTLAEEWALAIGVPLKEWVGNCYAISRKIVDADLVGDCAKAVYGHWRGEIDPASMFYTTYGKIGFARHGWIRLHDGTIVDPTRWVFEGTSPYIWMGQQNDEYDEGGNHLRRAMESPPPEYDATKSACKLDWSGYEEYEERIYRLLDYIPEIQINHVFWLANLSLFTLGDLAEVVYKLLIQNGFSALIPLDNRRKVLEEK